MKKFILALIVILFYGCSSDINQTLDQTKRIFHDNSPKWVKKIKKGKQIKAPFKRCYQTSIDNVMSTEDANKKVQTSIYQQIANELLSQVSTETTTSTTYSSNDLEKQFQQNVNIQSVADVSGVHINDIYYDKIDQKAYGYVCISESEFKKLQEENTRKYNEFIALMSELQDAINKGDREKANKLIIKIQTKFPNAKNNKNFIKLQREAEKIAQINVHVNKKFFVNSMLTAQIISNKTVYVAVVLEKNNQYQLLYPFNTYDNPIVKPNETKNLILIRKITPNLIGKNRLIFYFSYTPINLKDYVTTGTYLSPTWHSYIDDFKNTHYLKKIEKEFEVIGNMDITLCIHPNKALYYSYWGINYAAKLKRYLQKEFKITCKNNKYTLKLDYNTDKEGDVINVDITMSLYKKGKLLGTQTYSNIFYPNQSHVIDYYLIPNSIKMVNNLKNYLGN